MPRLRLVLAHGGGESVEAVELLLVADEGVERDLDPAAIEVAVEVEEVRFQQLLRRREGRADAEAGDAGMLAAVLERRAHRIDAVTRPLIVAERHVRGRIAKLPPALVAVLDDALDGEIAGHQLGRRGGVAGLERLADAAGGNAQVAEKDGRDRLRDDPV